MSTTEQARYAHKNCGGTTIWDLSGGFCAKCHAEGLDEDDVERFDRLEALLLGEDPKSVREGRPSIPQVLETIAAVEGDVPAALRKRQRLSARSSANRGTGRGRVEAAPLGEREEQR